MSTLYSSTRLAGKGLLGRLLLGTAVLALVGYWIQGTVERATKDQLANELRTVLRADVTALEMWLETHERNMGALSEAPQCQEAILALVEGAEERELSELRQSSRLQQLRDRLSQINQRLGYLDFVILTPGGRIVGAQHDRAIGKRPEHCAAQLQLALAGNTAVTPPFLDSGTPTMFVLGPVNDPQGRVAAVLGLRIDPAQDFTRILSVARLGETGETYAFDDEGLMLSQSRFDQQLREIGLLESGWVDSILHLQLRDPGCDLLAGFRTKTARPEQPFTRMAQHALSERPAEIAVDVDGYRDYRGVSVVGAWIWLEGYGFGVATEVDVAEAYRPLILLRWAFGCLFALLVLATLGVLVSMRLARVLQNRVSRARRKLEQLGQYQLGERIGEGGMGQVYLATHAMLRRPTALKLLRPDKSRPEDLARFEREVQLTSRLSHPNTIAIYDYGRTPEGVFYYAMEYLDGVSLEELVQQTGAQPEGRVIHILEQVCASLEEAHQIGLIHRDVKPANVVLCERGGTYDVVKVLDFGLVKEVERGESVRLTNPDAITGTPMYMSPEAVTSPGSVDARSDIYSIGALGYYLLTGENVFESESVMDVLMKHTDELPQLPSQRLGQPVCPSLEQSLMRCLEKDPALRFPSAQAMAEALEHCPAAQHWGRSEAREWWEAHHDCLKAKRCREEEADPPPVTSATVTVDLAARDLKVVDLGPLLGS